MFIFNLSLVYIIFSLCNVIYSENSIKKVPPQLIAFSIKVGTFLIYKIAIIFTSFLLLCQLNPLKYLVDINYLFSGTCNIAPLLPDVTIEASLFK